MIDTQGLTRSFGGLNAVDGVTFSVREGEIFGFLGPNGAGKTMLLKALQHLIPCQGEVQWSQEARLGYVPRVSQRTGTFP